MQKPLLFTYRRCPYAMRARMALIIAGIDFDAHEVSLRDKPAEMLELSPKGSVPVMLHPDGRVLEQSWDIMQWAMAEKDPDGWWARAQTPENFEWLARNNGEFKFHLDRYKYPERYENSNRNSHREASLQTFLQPLNDRLERMNYLGGKQPCATDIAIFPFVRQFASVEPNWFSQQEMSSLQRWLANWISSDLFIHCMHKLPSQMTSEFPLQKTRSG